MKFGNIYAMALAAALVLPLGACEGKGGKRQLPTGNTSTSGTVVIAADASFQNIVQEEIDVFEYCYPGASILARYADEHAVVDSLLFGSARCAVISRELTKDEISFLRDKRHIAKTKKIAVDAIAVIVNDENPVENLSISELREILSGEVTEWGQLSPTKLGKIQVVFDHSGSSVVKFMADSVLRGAKFAPTVASAETMPAVFEAVKERKDAIGLVSVSWISSDLKSADLSTEERLKTLEVDDTTATSFTDEVKVLPIRRDNSLTAYKPYQAYIFDGRYPLFRSIWMVNTGAAGSLASGFFSFVTSFRGQKLIQQTGVLPATVHQRMVEVE